MPRCLARPEGPVEIYPGGCSRGDASGELRKRRREGRRCTAPSSGLPWPRCGRGVASAEGRPTSVFGCWGLRSAPNPPPIHKSARDQLLAGPRSAPGRPQLSRRLHASAPRSRPGWEATAQGSANHRSVMSAACVALEASKQSAGVGRQTGLGRDTCRPALQAGLFARCSFGSLFKVALDRIERRKGRPSPCFL